MFTQQEQQYILVNLKKIFGPNSQSGLQHCGLYDEERKVESVEEKNGNIILHLVTDEETKGKTH